MINIAINFNTHAQDNPISFPNNIYPQENTLTTIDKSNTGAWKMFMSLFPRFRLSFINLNPLYC